MIKQQELLNALQEEWLRLEPKVGEEVKEEFDCAIKYLTTGKYNLDEIERYNLLEACVNDFEQIYKDYCG